MHQKFKTDEPTDKNGTDIMATYNELGNFKTYTAFENLEARVFKDTKTGSVITIVNRFKFKGDNEWYYNAVRVNKDMTVEQTEFTAERIKKFIESGRWVAQLMFEVEDSPKVGDTTEVEYTTKNGTKTAKVKVADCETMDYDGVECRKSCIGCVFCQRIEHWVCGHPAYEYKCRAKNPKCCGNERTDGKFVMYKKA